MDYLSKTIKDIKMLKIQGAEEVALAAIDAWNRSPDKKRATAALKAARPTEPMLRNVLNYLNKFDDAEKLVKRINEDMKKIAEFGSRIIKNGSAIYTHCHSASVEDVLLHAEEVGKNITVNVTETRPDFQGRITAKHLAAAGISVNMFVDSAAYYAMKDVDLMLIGADAITAYGDIVNKVGTHLFAKAASEHGIPVYVVAHSFKFDPMTEYGNPERIESRSAKEVWSSHPKRIKIINPVFDVVPSKYIVAVVTEIGVLKSTALVDALNEKYSWMFR
ncbi:MAG: translation initiation factor eIF-2B [Candidatus Micrarchaeia archaeon]